MTELSPEQVEEAFKELVVKFPRVERLPVDPPLAGQNYGLFSFRLFPKPVNGTYGFLKFRGSFATESEWEAHAKNIIRTVDSRHHIWPFKQGHWMPITTNEEFAQSTLEVYEKDDMSKLFGQDERESQKKEAQKVREIKDRERKLLEETRRKEPDTDSLDYYAQKAMSVQQLESWLETMRKRKRDMIKALRAGKQEMERLELVHPEYLEQVTSKIDSIRAEIGLEPGAPLDQPSFRKA